MHLMIMKHHNRQPSSLVYLHQQECPSNKLCGNGSSNVARKRNSAVVIVRQPKSAKRSAKSGRSGVAAATHTVPGCSGGRKWQKKRQQQNTHQEQQVGCAQCSFIASSFPQSNFDLFLHDLNELTDLSDLKLISIYDLHMHE